MEYSLVIENLVKTYDDVLAVNNISLKVRKGELFAFLGINGAGKSTTINIVCSIISKDSGKVIVEGLDIEEDTFKIKHDIGIVFQNSVLDEKLTVLENLDIRASFYSLSNKEKKENIALIIELLDLKPILNKPINKLSGGQKRRVDIARAMVHKPKLLILDEPTTGLDPKTRLIVWNLINKIREETGMTVFLTTHYMEEAEKASYVVIMDKGNILEEGTPVELKNKFAGDYIISYSSKNEEFENILSKDNIKYFYNEENHLYKITIKNTLEAKNMISKYDKYLNDIEILKGTMDDVFLNVTDKKEIYLGENDE